MLKFHTVVLVICLATCNAADTKPLDLELNESPRFGFTDITNSGSTFIFNSTSLQYAVVTGIVLVIVALAVIPLFGLSLGSFFSSRNEYDNPYYTHDTTQAYSSYSAYAQRSLDILSPVLKALRDAYLKYA